MNMESNNELKPNWPLLALLRFVLAFVVLVVHIKLFVKLPPLLAEIYNLSAYAAIGGFLMISGYSIRHSLLKDGDAKEFYNRRMHRIYPVYLLSLLLAASVFFLYGALVRLESGFVAEAPTPFQFIAHLFMLQGIVAPTNAAIVPAWTLAVECLFYAAAPYLARLAPQVVTRLMVASFALCVVAQHAFAPSIGILSAASLLWLFLLGWQMRDGSIRSVHVFYLLPITGIAFNDHQAGPQSSVLVAFVVFAMLTQNKIQLPRRVQVWATYAGELSYPLYIAQMPVLLLLWLGTGMTSPSLHIAAVVAASAVIYHVIDKPFRHNRRTPVSLESGVSNPLIRVGVQ